jgi:hypothetical protein
MRAIGGDLADGAGQPAYRPGEAIAEHDALLLTGACPGSRTRPCRGPKYCFCEAKAEDSAMATRRPT